MAKEQTVATEQLLATQQQQRVTVAKEKPVAKEQMLVAKEQPMAQEHIVATKQAVLVAATEQAVLVAKEQPVATDKLVELMAKEQMAAQDVAKANDHTTPIEQNTELLQARPATPAQAKVVKPVAALTTVQAPPSTVAAQAREIGSESSTKREKAR